ncbi:MAG: outer membrane beta-barrel protein [Vicinamibacterales bacterium]
MRACTRFAAVLLGVAVPGLAAAQEAAPPDPSPWRSVDFGVTLETYYQFNTNDPPDRVTPLRAYDARANTFDLQQVTAVAALAPDVEAGRRFGMRVDLMFGPATAAVQGSAVNEPRPEVYRNIWQAYGTYVFPVGRGLRADVGKFASNLGFETSFAKDNDHFSRAYLFGFLPFYHAGVRVTLPVTDHLTLQYALSNGAQQAEEFNAAKSSHVTAVLTPLPTLSWTVNYYAGREQPDQGMPRGANGLFTIFDTYAAWTPSPRFSAGLDLNRTSNDPGAAGGDTTTLTGLGAYGRTALVGPTSFALRYERLDDEGLFAGVDQVLQEITGTLEWRAADGFLLRGELRRDWSDRAFFPGPHGAADLRRSQVTVEVGLVWWLGTLEGVW